MTVRLAFASLAASMLLIFVLPAHADPTSGTASARPQPDKVSTLVVYGDDPCPKGKGDDIVVCARRPENERYRLPKRFREKPAGVAQGSWTNRALDLERASSQVLPDSCSPIGSNGQSGCFHQFLQQSRDQRKADQAEAAGVP